jgi:hypothetical protein
VVQVGRCKARQCAQLSDRDFAKLSGTGISNPSSIAQELLKSVYTAFPQDASAELQLQAKRRIGKY